MEKLFKSSIFRTVSCLILLLFLFSGVSISQEKKVDKEKLYKEIVGEYEFDFEGQVMIIKFWVEDGKLLAGPEGEEPAELEPVEGEELKFQATTPDGEFFEMEFSRDEKGKITKCKINTMGMEFEGKKIKDDKGLPA